MPAMLPPPNEAALTRLSVSLAESGKSSTAPVATLSVLGHDGTMGCATTPQLPSGEAMLRGVGAAVVKSVLLLSASLQPLAPRSKAVVADGAGAGLVSEQLAVPP